jgi:hypothetical protein
MSHFENKVHIPTFSLIRHAKKIYCYVKIKEDEMGAACRIHRKYEK